MAWLITVPEGKDKTRRDYLTLSQNEKLLNPPELIGYEYILEYLQELGYTDKEGAGLPYQEIEAWSRLTNTTLSYWDVIMLKTLSKEVAVQLQKKDINEPSPCVTELE